jgi:hypothetical protein
VFDILWVWLLSMQLPCDTNRPAPLDEGDDD